MPINQDVTQQLAALVAVVSVAIIGVAFMLVPSVWKGLTESSVIANSIEKRAMYQALFIIITPFLGLLAVIDLFGIYAPSLVQAAITISLLILMILMLVILLRVKNKSNLFDNILPLPFLYGNTLVWIALCILSSLFALLGVASTMLNIVIGPFALDNFNFAKWCLFDGIFFFFISIIDFAFIFMFQKFDMLEKPNNIQHSKKKPLLKWVVSIFAIIIILFTISLVSSIKQYNEKHMSFIDAFLSIPLTVKPLVNINGTQFSITNLSSFDWENITLYINEDELSSGYTLYLNSLNKGQTYTIDIEEFANNEGIRFDPTTMKPVRCSIKVYNSLEESGTWSGPLVYTAPPGSSY